MSDQKPGINWIDIDRPNVPKGELLCDACWAVSANGDHRMWITYNFKHLKQTNICPKCVATESQRLTEMQAKGM